MEQKVTPTLTNPILKQLHPKTRYQKILGDGKFGVTLDTGKKSRLGKEKKLYRVVTILSSQYGKDPKHQFAKIKEKLKAQGVHVMLSGNFTSIPYSPTIKNAQVQEEIDLGKLDFKSSNQNLKTTPMWQYEEEWAPGAPLAIEQADEIMLTIPTAHYEKVFEDAYQILSSGLYLDANHKNIFYDEKSGFWFIDLDYDPQDVDTFLQLFVGDYFHLYPRSISYKMTSMERYLSGEHPVQEKQYVYQKTKEQILFYDRITNTLEQLCQRYPLASFSLYVQDLKQALAIAIPVLSYYEYLLNSTTPTAPREKEENTVSPPSSNKSDPLDLDLD